MDNIDEQMGAFEAMLSGINPAAGAQQPEEPKATGTNEPAPQAQTQQGAEPAQPPVETQPQAGMQAQVPDDKSNKAFAQMRVQNKKQADALARVLASMGVDQNLAGDPDKLLEMLDEASTTAKAKEMQVPPELLKKINQLEKMQADANAERAYNNAMAGFSAIQQKHGLSQQELTAFAVQLQESNINPFEGVVDLEREYLLLNLDRVLEKANQRAVQEALAKQGKAQEHSTTPSKTQGKPMDNGAGADKINTMAQFDRLLFSLK